MTVEEKISYIHNSKIQARYVTREWQLLGWQCRIIRRSVEIIMVSKAKTSAYQPTEQ